MEKIFRNSCDGAGIGPMMCSCHHGISKVDGALLLTFLFALLRTLAPFYFFRYEVKANKENHRKLQLTLLHANLLYRGICLGFIIDAASDAINYTLSLPPPPFLRSSSSSTASHRGIGVSSNTLGRIDLE